MELNQIADRIEALSAQYAEVYGIERAVADKWFRYERAAPASADPSAL